MRYKTLAKNCEQNYNKIYIIDKLFILKEGFL